MWLAEQIPLLNLHGGAFLLFYAIFAAVTLGISYRALKRADRTSVTSLPWVPSDPDPIEMAYLAGGENNVIRVVVYDLIQRGLVAFDAESRLRATQAAAHPGKLTNLEEQILAAVQFNPGAADIYDNAMLRRAVRDACAAWHGALEAQEILLPRSVSLIAKRVVWISLTALVGLTALKTSLALLQGRTNVGWLVLLTVIASGALVVIVLVQMDNRLSKRGNAWLATLRVAYSSAKTEALAPYVNVPSEPQQSASVIHGASLFLIGLYGFEILRGTSDQQFAELFKRGSDAGVSACGASGGGGGGCGGCGGGCGG